MSFFNGIKKLKRLPLSKQKRFELYFERHLQYRLRPLFGDLSLFISIIGAMIFISTLAHQVQGFTNVHPLVYAYLAMMCLFAVIHKLTKIRYSSPAIIYMMFVNMSLFGYLDYLAKGGDLSTLFGLLLFISSIGFITFSLKHSLVIVGLFLLLLFGVSVISPNIHNKSVHVIEILSNWLVIMCLLLAPASAMFNRKLFRNIFALQFLLTNTNIKLKKTFHSLKKTEDQLIQQQKHQALNHMAAGLLHEIINPANCSIQAINYAKTINNDDELIEVLADASEHQARIVKIVEELKSFSQTKPETEKCPSNMTELVDSAVNLCRSELKAIKVYNQLPEDLVLDCYPTAVVQVLVNLLNNSKRAIEKKADVLEPMINIESSTDQNTVSIIFIDNGVGIAVGELEKITQPFYSTNETSEQLGLGLSICQTIMRHHKGSFKIESEQGDWTRVTLNFPL